MTTESLLVKTKDNYIIVFNITFADAAEKTRLSQECENICGGLEYKDFNSGLIHSRNISFDAKNTSFLKEEITGYSYLRKPAEYTNTVLPDNFPDAVKKGYTLHFDGGLSDSSVPEMIKSIGYKIEPVDELYEVTYDAVAGKYKIKNYKTRMATVYHGQHRIEVVRNHFKFDPRDFARLEALIVQYNREKASNPQLDPNNYMLKISNSRDRNLFKIYAHEQYAVEHREQIMAHEFKHIKNEVFAHGLSLKKNAKRLSVENMYRICVENERSAYIEQMFYCINAYLKNGDYNNFSMFDNDNSTIVDDLKALPTDEERRRYAMNIPVLLAKKWSEFENCHREFYDETSKQFSENVKNMVNTAPLSVPKDVDGGEYRRLRSLYYRYQIYNPETGRDEYVDLSPYITEDKEVTIPDKVKRSVIDPQAEELEKRLDGYRRMVHRREINPMLVDAAKTLMRSAAENTAFINEVDSLRISRLFDDSLPPPPPPAAPSDTPAPVAEDGGKWDELKAYWQRVDGYREVVCNRDEYRFSLNDTSIRYTGKNDVSVSENAEYDHYVKILNAPGSERNKIEFLDTLTSEQALTLYVACVNNGREMTGKVPTDLSGLGRLRGIPTSEMDKFRRLVAGTLSPTPTPAPTPTPTPAPTPSPAPASPSPSPSSSSRFSTLSASGGSGRGSR